MKPWYRRWSLRRMLADAVLLFCLLMAAEWLAMECSPLPPDLLRRLETSPVLVAGSGEVLGTAATSQGERVMALEAEEIPSLLRRALVRAEDERFWWHGGVDFAALIRAAVQNLSAGEVVSGASTLSMQLLRILHPQAPRDLRFKLAQLFRARQLETVYSKEEILRAYCNHVPLGGALRGFEAAAWRWFGRPLVGLGLAEICTLVVMLPAPSRRAPNVDPRGLQQLRDRLLARMRGAGDIGRREYDAAVATPLIPRRWPWPRREAHLLEHQLREMPRRRWRSGIDLRLQQRIRGLLAGENAELGDGLAVVVLQRGSGRLRAMIGGWSYQQSQVNCATRPRSLGSTLKPFLFALAVERGALGRRSQLRDRPMRFGGYQPANFSRDYLGVLPMQDALFLSRNLPALGLLQQLGTGAFAELCMGLGLPLDDRGMQLDAALGTQAATPLQLARAYRRFADEPHRCGLSPRSRDAVLDAMRQTRLAGRRLPPGLACKTGTSSGRRDAWAVGVTPRHVLLVWRGNLNGRGESGLVGAQAAAPLLCRLHSLVAD